MEWNGPYYDRDRWRAGGGTTALGVIGTAAGGAALIGQTMAGNGWFGRGNQNCEADKLRAENAELRAELKMDDKLLERDNRYKDDLERFYGRFEIVAGRLATLESEHQCLQKQLTDYAIHQKEIDELERKLLRKDIEGVNKDLGCLAEKVETGFCATKNRFAGIDAVLGSFTATVVKESAICDTGCNRACIQ